MDNCILMIQGYNVLDYTWPYEVSANVLRDPDSAQPEQAFDISLFTVDEAIQ